MSRAGRAVPVECGSDARRFFGIRLPLPPGLEHQRPSSSFAPPQPRPGCSLTYQRSKIRLPGPGTSRQARRPRPCASPTNCSRRGYGLPCVAASEAREALTSPPARLRSPNQPPSRHRTHSPVVGGHTSAPAQPIVAEEVTACPASCPAYQRRRKPLGDAGRH